MLINKYLFHHVVDPVKNSAKTVIIVHGIAEHQGRYEHIAKFLNKSGYNVIRYDLRGHGRSQGPRGKNWNYKNMVNDLRAFVLYANNNFPGKLFLLGHSLGGLIVNLYATFYHDVDGIISSSAPTNFVKDVLPVRIIPWPLLGWVPQKTNFADDKLSRIKEVEDEYNKDPFVLNKFYISLAASMMVGGVRALKRRVKNIVILIVYIYGSDDKIVPVKFSEEMYHKISSKDKELMIFQDSYHEIFNDLDKQDALDFIKKWLDERS